MRGCYRAEFRMNRFALTFIIAITCVSAAVGQAELAERDYAVYAHVLREIYKHNRETYSNKSEFVIVNKTQTDPELELPRGKQYRTLVDAFKRNNKSSSTLERKFPRGAYSETYYLLSQAEIDELEEKGRVEYEKRKAIDKSNPCIINPGGVSYTVFYQKYPESSGYYYLSRVGFSGQLAWFRLRATLAGTDSHAFMFCGKRKANGERLASAGASGFRKYSG
jgi:hypothetical protein